MNRVSDSNFLSPALSASIAGGRRLDAANPDAVLGAFRSGGDALTAYAEVIVRVGARGLSAELPALARMRRALFEAGFVPAQRAKSDPPTDGSVCYVRSSLIDDAALAGVASLHAVSMTDLGSLGRFGNQLFQYAFLKLYALRNHLSLKVPPWQGESYFGFADERSSADAYPDLIFGGFDDDDLAFWEMDAPPANVNFSGFFQEIPACWIPHRRFLRRLFSLRLEWRLPLERLLAQLHHDERTLVAIHVRRGDYLEASPSDVPWFQCVPAEWYRALLDELWPTVRNPVLFVSTDGGDDVRAEFTKYRTLDEAATLSAMPELVRDFALLQGANVLALCNSSFSRMAALLADETQECFLPSFSQARFQPYDAWADRAFWRRFGPSNGGTGLSGSDISAVRRRSVHYREALGLARHMAPSSLRRVAAATPQGCKICGAAAPLFGLLDFNEWGDETPADRLSGIPIYYRRCEACGLIFTEYFDTWSAGEFQRSIYNKEFVDRLLPGVMAQRRASAHAAAALFPDRGSLSLLDYGGLNRPVVELLEREGFASVQEFDLFQSPQPDFNKQKFDIVSCFDVLHRLPNPMEDIAAMAARLVPQGVCVFTAATKADAAPALGLSALHVGPRRGQIHAFSHRSLALAWERVGFAINTVEDDLHLAYRVPR
jgi:hypothetical protein